VENRRRRNELKHKKALKALESSPAPSAPLARSPPPAPAPVPSAIPSAIPDPDTTTTVLKVYLSHKEMFHMLRPDQRKAFLVKSGHLSSAAYTLRHGVPPKKAEEDGNYVNVFPIEEEGIVLNQMLTAYRQVTAGAKQTTLDAAFVRQAGAAMA